MDFIDHLISCHRQVLGEKDAEIEELTLKLSKRRKERDKWAKDLQCLLIKQNEALECNNYKTKLIDSNVNQDLHQTSNQVPNIINPVSVIKEDVKVETEKRASSTIESVNNNNNNNNNSKEDANKCNDDFNESISDFLPFLEQFDEVQNDKEEEKEVRKEKTGDSDRKIFDERSSCEKPPPTFGFSTANGKPVTFSKAALDRVKDVDFLPKNLEMQGQGFTFSTVNKPSVIFTTPKCSSTTKQDSANNEQSHNNQMEEEQKDNKDESENQLESSFGLSKKSNLSEESLKSHSTSNLNNIIINNNTNSKLASPFRVPRQILPKIDNTTTKFYIIQHNSNAVSAINYSYNNNASAKPLIEISTASGKSVPISKTALDKVKAMWEKEQVVNADYALVPTMPTSDMIINTAIDVSPSKKQQLESDEDERSKSPLLTPSISVPPLPQQQQHFGFSTANGRAVQVSKEALNRVRNMLKHDEFEEDQQITNRQQVHEDVGNIQVPTTIINKPSFGFSTGNGKPVQVSNEALNRINILRKNKSKVLKQKEQTNEDEEKIVDENNHIAIRKFQNPQKIQPSTITNPSFGFSTGSGKAVKVSEEALNRVKNMFKDDELNLRIDDISPIKSLKRGHNLLEDDNRFITPAKFARMNARRSAPSSTFTPTSQRYEIDDCLADDESGSSFLLDGFQSMDVYKSAATTGGNLPEQSEVNNINNEEEDEREASKPVYYTIDFVRKIREKLKGKTFPIKEEMYLFEIPYLENPTSKNLFMESSRPIITKLNKKQQKPYRMNKRTFYSCNVCKSALKISVHYRSGGSTPQSGAAWSGKGCLHKKGMIAKSGREAINFDYLARDASILGFNWSMLPLNGKLRTRQLINTEHPYILSKAKCPVYIPPPWFEEMKKAVWETFSELIEMCCLDDEVWRLMNDQMNLLAIANKHFTAKGFEPIEAGHDDGPMSVESTQCEHCKEWFYCMSALKTHILISHTPEEELPHQCGDCSRRFSTPSHLNAHKLSAHTPIEDRPFKCELCDVRFCYASGLNKHKPFHLSKSPLRRTLSKEEKVQKQKLEEEKKKKQQDKQDKQKFGCDFLVVPVASVRIRVCFHTKKKHGIITPRKKPVSSFPTVL